MSETVTKITLSTGKVVLIRDIKIKHTELAAQAAAPRAGGDPHVLGLMMQKELVKLLVCEIDGRRPAATELENLDELLTISEYAQINRVIEHLTGGNQVGKLPPIEVVTSGSK